MEREHIMKGMGKKRYILLKDTVQRAVRKAETNTFFFVRVCMIVALYILHPHPFNYSRFVL